jgi:hypothetical protein
MSVAKAQHKRNESRQGLAIPALFQDCGFVSAGGLMSYDTSIPDACRLAGG